MAMPLVAPRYTIADLDRFPDDGNRYELLGGVLLVTPAPGAPHQVALGRITVALSVYLGLSGQATVATPGVIQVDDDTQLEPDLLVIPARYADRPSWRQMTDWWLAVEVSGRDSRVYDRDFKTGAYLRVGVREVWRVDLRDRTVYVSRQGEPADVPHAERLIWHPAEMDEPLDLDLTTILRSPAP
jgi:Uma2 family endonuclease